MRRVLLFAVIILTIGISATFIWRFLNKYSQRTSANTDPKAELRFMLEDIRGLPQSQYKYNVHDSAGNRMDVLKIVDNPQGGYIGVYHNTTSNPCGPSHHNLLVATSNDLLNWTYRNTLDLCSHQGDIKVLSNGGVLVAYEHAVIDHAEWGTGGGVKMKYFNTVNDLLNAQNSRDLYLFPRTLGEFRGGAEGTPNIYDVQFRGDPLNPSITNSYISYGFHYQCKNYLDDPNATPRCQFADRGITHLDYPDAYDRIAFGDVENFNASTRRAWDDDQKNIPVLDGFPETNKDTKRSRGDRDFLIFRGNKYFLIETNLPGKFDTFKSFIFDDQTKSFTNLNFNTHNGASTFGNPTYSQVTLPNGKLGMVATVFVFQNGPEFGPLVYYRELAQDLQPTPTTAPVIPTATPLPPTLAPSIPTSTSTPIPTSTPVPPTPTNILTTLTASPVPPTITLSPTSNPPTSSPTPEVVVCQRTRGDSNCDGVVNIADFAEWRTSYIQDYYDGSSDFNSDNKVDLIDFAIWLENLE